MQITVDTVFDADNLLKAFDNLNNKHDGCGIDGVKLSELYEYWKLNGPNIILAIKEGKYEPGVVSLTEILKSNGKRRTIAKINSVDRLIIRSISQILTPVLESELVENCFSYREGKSIIDAASLAAKYMNDGLSWVCEVDIKSFFDSIRHDIILQMLKQLDVFEKEVFLLVEKYINCKAEHYGEESVIEIGLLQGSPLSPILSNYYLSEIDKWLLSEGVSFVRFGDDINMYFEELDDAYKYQEVLRQWLKEFGLFINPKKGGVFKGENRTYLGYEFIRVGSRLIVKRASSSKKQIYNKWRSVAIEKIDSTYHIINSGILTRKDFTMLFENDEGKYFLPIETIGSLNVYSDITFSSGFFEFVSNRGVCVSFVNSKGERIGNFVPTKPRGNYKTELKQVDYRINEEKQLPIAKKYQAANIFNLRAILRYYVRRDGAEEISEAVTFHTDALDKVNNAKDVNSLLMIEAQARQKYYHCFNYIIGDENFIFNTRSKRPPKDAINAMISFGNSILYQRFASLIYLSSLDIRFGILHNSYYRSESLNLDLADLFKPVLVDRTIFTLVNKKMISIEDFQEIEGGGVYLNKRGKRVFIKEFEKKLQQTVKINQVPKTYEQLMRDEVKKVENFFRKGEPYKPYKYVN